MTSERPPESPEPQGAPPGEAFRDAIKPIRDALRAKLAESAADLKQVAHSAHMPLIEALVAFGDQRQGTRGQTWALLVERATRKLEYVQTLEDPSEVRTIVADAEQLLAMALGDMNG